MYGIGQRERAAEESCKRCVIMGSIVCGKGFSEVLVSHDRSNDHDP